MSSNNGPAGKSSEGSSGRPLASAEQVKSLLSDLKDMHRQGMIELAPGNSIGQETQEPDSPASSPLPPAKPRQ